MRELPPPPGAAPLAPFPPAPLLVPPLSHEALAIQIAARTSSSQAATSTHTATSYPDARLLPPRAQLLQGGLVQLHQTHMLDPFAPAAQQPHRQMPLPARTGAPSCLPAQPLSVAPVPYAPGAPSYAPYCVMTPTGSDKLAPAPPLPLSNMLGGSNAVACMQAAERLAQLGEFAAAAKSFQHAYRVSPAPLPLVRAADMALASGDLNQAERWLCDVLKRSDLDDALREEVRGKLAACTSGAMSALEASPAPKPTGPAPVKAQTPKAMPPLPDFVFHGRPATSLSISIEGQYAVRDTSGRLILDKRLFTMRAAATDSEGNPAKPIKVCAKLVFEDMEPIPAEHRYNALMGTTVATMIGDAQMRLRVNLMSSSFGRRRFRLMLVPYDPEAAAAGLSATSEPFEMVYDTKKHKDVRMAVAGIGPAAGRGTAGAERPHMAALDRRRYFRNAEIAAATTTSGPAQQSRLTLGALRLCDRLAAIVTQQVTQKAMMAARKRPPDVVPPSMPPAKRTAPPFGVPSAQSSHANSVLPRPAPAKAPRPALLVGPRLAAGPGGSVRRTRCGVCIRCQADDCGLCRNCLDKPKFGGPGSRKSACIRRTCVQIAKSGQAPPDVAGTSPRASVLGLVPNNAPLHIPTKQEPQESIRGADLSAAAATSGAAFTGRTAAPGSIVTGYGLISCLGTNDLPAGDVSTPKESGTQSKSAAELAAPDPLSESAALASVPLSEGVAGAITLAETSASATAPSPAPFLAQLHRMSARQRWALRARDVVAAVRRPGNYDFLYHTQVLKRWEPPQPQRPSERERVASRADAREGAVQEDIESNDLGSDGEVGASRVNNAEVLSAPTTGGAEEASSTTLSPNGSPDVPTASAEEAASAPEVRLEAPSSLAMSGSLPQNRPRGAPIPVGE